MPGLMRGVARTAVVAGTATAVSNRVSRRQASRWSQPQAEAAQEPVVEAPAQPAAPAAPATPAAPAAATSATDRIAALKDLADLQAAGVLSPEEFEAEKARLLAS